MPIIPISLLILLWIYFRLALPAGPFNMDPCGKGTFFAHLILYSVFSYAQVVLGVFGAIWAFGHGQNWPATLLLFSALYAFLFAGLLAFFYESYMVANYPTNIVGTSNYTLNKYALVLALGVSSVLLLIAGGASLAMETAK